MKILLSAIVISLFLCPFSLRAETDAPSARSGQAVVAERPEEQIPSPQLDSEDGDKGPDLQGDEEEDGGGADKGEAEEEEAAPEQDTRIPDPFVSVNRVVYQVNDRFYFWLLKPVAQAYGHIPEDIRVVVSNVYDNLKAPARFLNNAMQLRLRAAGTELARFVINSLAGVGGIGDAARDAFGIKKQDADFDQTLGHYGLGHGFYIVLPVFGPSSVRAAVGLVGDRLMYPLTYVRHEDLSYAAATGIAAHEMVNETSFRIGDYEAMKDAAIDPYVSMRNAFTQYRQKKVRESIKKD
ncbi:MAG: VacJ family lipoprotein [Nitrospiraceae bacterium]|nr:VacJ family lipoprotein [Nitrospiraceae bacterium]